MSSDKPLKLSPESVHTFLEFGLKHVVNEQKAAYLDEERRKSLMFKFVRMLCVSNSYLNCSRRTNLDIYRLNLSFDHYSDKLSFSSKRYDFISEVHLAYHYVRKLINLLLPPYTGAYFGSSMDENLFELLKLTKGKIGLYLCSLNGQFAQKVMKAFVARIHEFHCSIEFLMSDKSLKLPILDCLHIDSLQNFGQIFYVMQYKVKKLEFGSFYGNFAIGDGNLVESNNETVKKLNLSFGELDYVKIEKLLEYLRKTCLNLKHLEMTASYDYEYYAFPANEALDLILDYVRRMNNLKTRFGNGLISMLINFNVGFDGHNQRDNTWIKTMCENSELTGWKVKSSKNNFGCDILEMTFDEAECKLEMSITLYP